MTTLSQICVSDGFQAPYGDRPTFMKALADVLNIEFVRARVKDVEICDVIWNEPKQGDTRTWPIATVCARPGGDKGLLTVERIRAAYAERERVRRTVREHEEEQRRLL
jgi:hypothetical protein